MRSFQEQQIIAIRRLALGGQSVRLIAREFSSSPTTIQKIITGQTYADMGGPITHVGDRVSYRGQIGAKNTNARLRALQVIEIREKLRAGVPRRLLAESYKVSRSTIDKLANTDNWCEPYLFGNRSHPFPDPALLELNLRDSRPLPGSDEENQLVERTLSAYRQYGYPYRRWQSRQFVGYLDRIRRSIAQISDDGIITGSASGLRLLNAFHPSIEHVSRKGVNSPVEIFQNDQSLKKTVLEQIRFGARLTPAGVRSALTETSGSSQISAFRPTIACALIKHFSAKRVLDPCAGWGGRMVGAIAMGTDYVGIDPNTAAITGNLAFLTEMRQTCSIESTVELMHKCAEDVLSSDLDLGEFDLILTSPPYFDLEHYSREPTQSYLRYPSLEEWSQFFLAKLLVGAARRLSKDGQFAINVSNELGDVIRTAAGSIGLEEVKTFRIAFGSRRWQKAQGKQTRLEPVIILRRRNE